MLGNHVFFVVTFLSPFIQIFCVFFLSFIIILIKVFACSCAYKSLLIWRYTALFFSYSFIYTLCQFGMIHLKRFADKKKDTHKREREVTISKAVAFNVRKQPQRNPREFSLYSLIFVFHNDKTPLTSPKWLSTLIRERKKMPTLNYVFRWLLLFGCLLYSCGLGIFTIQYPNQMIRNTILNVYHGCTVNLKSFYHSCNDLMLYS